MSFNKVFLLGNLCNDPKITVFDDGGKVAAFSIATGTRGYTMKDGREIKGHTDYHNVRVNHSGLAGIVEKYLKKGSKVFIAGELRQKSYEDKTGQKRYSVEVYADTIEILNMQPQQPQQPQQQQQPAGRSESSPNSNNGELPF